MSRKNESKSSSIGLGALIFIVLLTLKLAGIGVVATWSWWWITAPLWAPIIVVLVILSILGWMLLAVAVKMNDKNADF